MPFWRVCTSFGYSNSQRQKLCNDAYISTSIYSVPNFRRKGRWYMRGDSQLAHWVYNLNFAGTTAHWFLSDCFLFCSISSFVYPFIDHFLILGFSRAVHHATAKTPSPNKSSEGNKDEERKAREADEVSWLHLFGVFELIWILLTSEVRVQPHPETQILTCINSNSYLTRIRAQMSVHLATLVLLLTKLKTEGGSSVNKFLNAIF